MEDGSLAPHFHKVHRAVRNRVVPTVFYMHTTLASAQEFGMDTDPTRSRGGLRKEGLVLLS